MLHERVAQEAQMVDSGHGASEFLSNLRKLFDIIITHQKKYDIFYE